MGGNRQVNYYKHHIGDYDSATAHLSWLEDMAYSRLLRLYYRRELPLPADLSRTCRLVRANTKQERESVASVLSEFFVLEDDGWHNARCDEEIGIAKEKADVNREVGKLGGRPSKSKTQTVSENNPDGLFQETQTVSENNPSHKPLATSHKPVTTSHKPEAKESKALKPRQSQHPSGDAENAPPTRMAWLAYDTAYQERYGVKAVRNAKANALIAQLVKRLGATEAPDVARWYVRHNSALYVRSKHTLDLLIRDCEGLRTEWITGQQVTGLEAQTIERKQANYNAFAPLIAEAEAREKAEKEAANG